MLVTYAHSDQISVRPVLFLLLVSAMSVAFSTNTANGADRLPNIILIFTDDQGYQDIGCFGSTDIRTPHLDAMAQEGRKFTDFYVGAPVCSASRAALLTGCYCSRVGITGVLFPRNKNGLHPQEVTLADLLKQKNYATTCIGKWHLGHKPKFLPTRQGFDSYFGIPYSNDMTIDPTAPLAKDIALREEMTIDMIRQEKPKKNWVPLMRNEEVIEYPADQRTLTKRYTEEALQFISENQKKPFFIYLPHTMPHIPLFVSGDFQNRNKQKGIYGDVIEEIDWSVGEILKKLKECNIDENTLVIYTSDNGPWLSKGKAGGSALPLRDGKFTTYEGGMRVPCIMRWPNTIPAGTVCSEVAATIDLLPTFADLTNIPLPPNRTIDGKSIRKLMTDPAAKSPHEAYFLRDQAVRSGHWKLLIKGRSTVKGQKAGPFPELYDLSEDPGESKNIAAEHPTVVKRLTQLIKEHQMEIKQNKRPAGMSP